MHESLTTSSPTAATTSQMGGWRVGPHGCLKSIVTLLGWVVWVQFISNSAMGSVHWPQETQETQEKQESRVILIEGQIVNAAGGGQRDVKVEVHRVTTDGKAGELIAQTTTDLYGDFVIKASQPVKGDVIVTMTKAQFADRIVKLRLGEEDQPPYVAESLEGNLSVTGKVFDHLTDKPIHAAAVVLRGDEKDWKATTGKNGEFTMKGIPPGQVTLIVEAKGYGRERVSVGRVETAEEIVVRMKAERIVHIRVTDEEETPISGVTVECQDQRRNDFRVAVTDQSGRVTLRGIHFDVAFLDVRLTHPEFVSSMGFDREIVTPAEEVESSHHFVLKRSGGIIGKVADAETGDPIGGARVMTGSQYSDASPRDWASYEGTYKITGVEPGETVITVHAGGYAPELKTVDVQAGGVAKVDFVLRPEFVVRGVVNDEQGKPVAGVMVWATSWRGHRSLGLQAMTAQDGSFTMAGAPRDGFEILVSNGMLAHQVQPGEDKLIELTVSARARAADRVTLSAGEEAPAVKLTTLEGEVIELAKLRGKTVMLDFWATWCGPCVEELPNLAKVHERFGHRKDFTMINISLDDDEASLRSFIKKHKMTWHQVFGEVGGAAAAADKFGVAGIPAVFLIDQAGNIAAGVFHGASMEDEVKRVIDMKGPP